MPHDKKKLILLALLAGLATALSACQTRKDFPQPNVGSHSPGYHTVFGRLQVIAAANPEADPVWVIHFGFPHDQYQGELAIVPTPALAGYSGGEPVEVRGHFFPQATTDIYNGRWYVIDSIQLWSGYRE